MEANPEAAMIAEEDFAEIEETADRLAQRKARAVVRDMLRQRGLDEGAAERQMARWEDRDQGRRGALEALREENAGLRLRLAALGRGVPAGRLESYLRVARGHVLDGLDEATALDRALEEFPLPAAGKALPGFAAETAAGRGGRALSRAEIDVMSPQELSERWSEVERFLERKGQL